MKAEYKRDLQNNYLILEAPEQSKEDSYGLRMAEINEIPGLLRFQCVRKDGKLYLHYEITSKQQLKNKYEKKLLSGSDILFLLSGIRDALDALQKYLLSPEQLVFDPEYMYLDPGRGKVSLCYLPGKNDAPITFLAEFILKKLDHEDRKAVEIGYKFYQKASEENFSLKEALKEILLSEREAPELGAVRQKQEKEQYEYQEAQRGRKYSEPQKEYLNESAWQETQYDQDDQRKDQQKDYRKEHQKEYQKNYQKECQKEYQKEYRKEHREEYREDRPGTSDTVIHKERKKHSSFKRTADWLFERIHPALFIAALFILAILEVAFYFGLIELTEAGGVFFLLISVETLLNKRWRNKKENKQQNSRQKDLWWEDDEELYRKLQEEMYQKEDSRQESEESDEETRYLVPKMEKQGIRLICMQEDTEKRQPNIYVEQEVVYVGKQRDENDVVLNVPTVSRMHAWIGMQDECYCIKDLNSKNGTFLNGRRLKPQEQCEIHTGDIIRFAEVEYQVMQT